MQKKAFLGIAAAAAVLLTVPTAASAAGTGHRSYEDPFSITSGPAQNLSIQPVDDGAPAPIVLGERNGSQLQHWTARYMTEGRYEFRNVSSNMCLTASPDRDPGVPFFAAECNDGPTQQFRPVFTPDGHGANIVTTADMCMDTDRGVLAPGARVVQNPCVGSPSQTWILTNFQE